MDLSNKVALITGAGSGIGAASARHMAEAGAKIAVTGIPAEGVEQVASALHLLVHLTRMPDGSRRVTNITEVVGMEGPTVTLQDIYEFDYEEEALRPTGIRPQFTDKLEALGFEFAPDLFGDPAEHRRALMRARR